MNLNLFQELLEKKLSSYETFLIKATDYQNEKNKARAKAKRWDEKKIDRAVNNMWTTVVRNIFDKVKTFDGCPGVNTHNPIETWTRFMEEKEIFEMLDTELSDIEFE